MKLNSFISKLRPQKEAAINLSKIKGTVTSFNVNSEIPFITISRKLQFNKYGLYLVAEEKESILTADFIMPYLTYPKLSFLGVFIFTSFYLNSFLYIIGLTLYLKLLHLKWLNRNNILERLFRNKIKKIFLSSDLKNVLLEIGDKVDNSYTIVDIKSFFLLDEKGYEETKNYIAFPIGVKNDDEKYIPFNMFIYDREIFTAICRGVSIKEQFMSEEKYVHLDTTGYRVKH